MVIAPSNAAPAQTRARGRNKRPRTGRNRGANNFKTSTSASRKWVRVSRKYGKIALKAWVPHDELTEEERAIYLPQPAVVPNSTAAADPITATPFDQIAVDQVAADQIAATAASLVTAATSDIYAEGSTPIPTPDHTSLVLAESVAAALDPMETSAGVDVGPDPTNMGQDFS